MNAPSLRSTGVWGKRRGIDDLLAKLSSNLPDFKSLVIMSTRNIDNDSAAQLVDILIQENDTLTELYASGHYLDSNGTLLFAKLLKHNKTIQTLSIGDANFGNDQLYLLCEGLIHNNGLQTIDLEYKGLDGTKNAAMLFSNLTKAVNEPTSTLTSINLSRNLLNNEGLEALAAGFKLNGGLGKLACISLCEIGCVGAEGIADFGKTVVKFLMQLQGTRSENYVGDLDKASELMKHDAIRDRKKLKLDFARNNDIGPVGCSAFISTGILCTLSELNLDGCNIGNLGIDTISRCLRYLSTTTGYSSNHVLLQKLSIRSNNITPTGALNFANALITVEGSVRDLDLGNNRCGKEAFYKLFYMQGLKNLCLLDNGVDDQYVLALQEHCISDKIAQKCKLEYLDLCGNQISDGTLALLCQTFLENVKGCLNNGIRKTLVLGSNPGISQEGVAFIENLNSDRTNNVRIMYDISQNAKGNVTGEKSSSVNVSDDDQFAGKVSVPLPVTYNKPFTYYLSPYESSRVKPAIVKNFSNVFAQVFDEDYKRTRQGPDFVWIHTLSKCNYDVRMSSTVCSQLAGIEVLENKANLALLCHDLSDKMMLKSYVVHGKKSFVKWYENEKRKLEVCSENQTKYCDGWIAKDATANGGEGLYQFTIDDQKRLQYVEANLHDDAEYVIQRYVNNPLLWDGKFKFHFRVYCVLNAKMEFFVYRRAFAHVCNKKYTARTNDDDNYDPEVHISNVAANIHDENSFHNYPTVDLPTEFPNVWLKLQNTMKNVIRKASTFMQYQTSKNNFMLIGADFIPDADGNIWLLELNCPPCMAAYQGADEESLESNKFEQAIRPLVSGVVRDVINDFVLPVLFQTKYGDKSDMKDNEDFLYGRSGNFLHINRTDESLENFEVKLANGAKDISKNILSWKVYKWRLRKRMSSSY
eukprot:g15589.t1